MLGVCRFKRYTNNMDDEAKIEKILKLLNTGIRDKSKWEWEEADGYHSLGSVTIKDGNVNLNADRGTLVKIFLNKMTGEIRPYYYKFTIRDSDAPH